MESIAEVMLSDGNIFHEGMRSSFSWYFCLHRDSFPYYGTIQFIAHDGSAYQITPASRCFNASQVTFARSQWLFFLCVKH